MKVGFGACADEFLIHKVDDDVLDTPVRLRLLWKRGDWSETHSPGFMLMPTLIHLGFLARTDLEAVEFHHDLEGELSLRHTLLKATVIEVGGGSSPGLKGPIEHVEH